MAEASSIRVVAFKEGDLWVGQCLEYDIGAQAPDLDTLHTRLVLAIGAERRESIVQHGAAFAGIDPAPQRFHAMWEKASGNFSPRHPTRARDDDNTEFQMALCA